LGFWEQYVTEPGITKTSYVLLASPERMLLFEPDGLFLSASSRVWAEIGFAFAVPVLITQSSHLESGPAFAKTIHRAGAFGAF
jgi:hypothetical protein